MPHNVADVPAPRTASQRRTYAARLALARARAANSNGTVTRQTHRASMAAELRVLRRITDSLVTLPDDARHRVLGLASAYLSHLGTPEEQG